MESTQFRKLTRREIQTLTREASAVYGNGVLCFINEVIYYRDMPNDATVFSCTNTATGLHFNITAEDLREAKVCPATGEIHITDHPQDRMHFVHFTKINPCLEKKTPDSGKTTNQSPAR